jgi:hypothetical protein
MTISPLTEAIAPAELVEAALGKDVGGFLTLYGDTLVLMVKVPLGDAELSLGLGATAVRAGHGTPVKPMAEPIEFHTVMHAGPANLRRAAPGSKEDPKALTNLLAEGEHFAVPLRKRGDADALFMERISVGRARNKDVVLRHRSISKFHAWFEVDELGKFHVTDAGSKNLTRVNGETLAPRVRTPVEAGSTVRFGAVDCIVSSPRALWTALRALKMRRAT